MLFRPCLVTSVVAIASAGCGDVSAPHVGTASQAIVSGVPDLPDSGGVALVRGSSANFLLALDTCSATLVAPNVALTARHCVERMSAPTGCSGTFTGQRTHPYLAIQVGPDLAKDAVRYVVKEVRVPASNGMCSGDIAALLLATSVPEAVLVPIAPRLDTPPAAGETFTAVGMGGTHAAEDHADGQRRRRAGMSVICVGAACAGASELWLGTGATCSGDSGGPALDAQGRVFGVAIRGDACLDPSTAAAYARTDAHAALLVQAALDGATLGGYAAPSWAVLPPPAPSGAPDAGGAIDAGGAGAEPTPPDATEGEPQASPEADRPSTRTEGGCAAAPGATDAGRAVGVGAALAALVAARRRRALVRAGVGRRG